LSAGTSLARFIAPGRQYPVPHLALPVWDSQGQRAGVYLDEIKMKGSDTDVRLRHEPRVMGSTDARFAGLQASRNGETYLAADIPAGFKLAQAHPDSGVIVRLAGDGIPHNIQRITGGVLMRDLDQALQPEPEKQDPAIEKARAESHPERNELDLKRLIAAEKIHNNTDVNRIIHQLAQPRIQQRLQELDLNIVRQKTLGD
jgi:hypothetical protein